MHSHSARLVLPLLLALAPCAWSQEQPFQTELVVAGLTGPTSVVAVPGLPDTFLVAEQEGRIRRVVNGVPDAQPILDISGEMFFAGLSGLSSMVLHPDFEQNGYLYVYFSSETLSFELRRYTFPNPAVMQIDPASALEIVTISHPSVITHQGSPAFGADGKLYLGVGDLRKESFSDGCVSQDGSSLLGKVLRFEADGSVPLDNPYLGDPTVDDRIYGFGLRQPFSMTWDEQTGDMYVCDVGEVSWEEVNVLPAGSPPPNFGWRYHEGTQCSDSFFCTQDGCNDPSFTFPEFEFDHGNGCCVIGGRVYRGSKLPTLHGKFVFADLCYERFWTMRYFGPGNAVVEEISDSIEMTDAAPNRVAHITTDHEGEILMVDHGQNFPGTGAIYRLIPRVLPLMTTVGQISVSAPETVAYRLNAPDEFNDQGLFYFLLGSASGTTPGLPIDGLTVPLNAPDAYLVSTITKANNGPFLNTLGPLEPDGFAIGKLQFSGPLPSSLAGVVVHHAMVLLDPAQGAKLVYASNPLDLALLP